MPLESFFPIEVKLSPTENTDSKQNAVVESASKNSRRGKSMQERLRETRNEATQWYQRSNKLEQEKYKLIEENEELKRRNEQLCETMIFQQKFITDLQQKVQTHEELKNAAKVYIEKFLPGRRACGKCHEMYDLMARPPKILACNHVFCKNCISECIDLAEYVLSQQLMIVCPEDNLKTVIPTGNIFKPTLLSN